MAKACGNGIAFDLSTLDGEGPWLDWCRTMGLSPQSFGSRNATARHGCFGLRALLRLVTQVRRKRYDAIYVIGLRAAFMLRFFRPWLRGARLVQGVRWNPNSQTRLDIVFRRVESLFHRWMDAYIVNSRAAAETLIGRCEVPSRKVAVIYNGLDALPSCDPARARSMNVVTVANLNPRKGHVDYLDAIERLQTSANFIFIGRDDMAGAVQHEIVRRGLEEKVCWVGFSDDIGRWLWEAHLMVLPSLWGEGCPTSILEGFGYGLPVVAYAIDGIPELVDHGENGILVAPGDKESFRAAIDFMLSDVESARRMGAAGRAKVEAGFTLLRCVEQHTEVFSALLDDTRKTA